MGCVCISRVFIGWKDKPSLVMCSLDVSWGEH